MPVLSAVACEPLQMLADDFRRRTISLFDEARDEELRWTPPGLSNHLLWHAGHVVWVLDKLVIEAATSCSLLPPGWPENFGKHCRPPAETTCWPERAEVRRELQRQLPRVLEVIGMLSPKALAGPPCSMHLPHNRSLGYWIAHGLHDEANHQGEMKLLLKMQRASACDGRVMKP